MKKRKGITLIELIIAMAVMTIIGVAIVGLASYITKSYQSINDKATARNLTMLAMDVIEKELIDAKTADITNAINTDPNYLQLYVDIGTGATSGMIMRKDGSSAAVPAFAQALADDGRQRWKYELSFTGSNNELLIVNIKLRKASDNSLIYEVSKDLYLPNIQLNNEVVQVNGSNAAGSGTHLNYIKGLVN